MMFATISISFYLNKNISPLDIKKDLCCKSPFIMRKYLSPSNHLHINYQLIYFFKKSLIEYLAKFYLVPCLSLVPFFRLHLSHNTCKLLGMLLPPLETGII